MNRTLRAWGKGVSCLAATAVMAISALLMTPAVVSAAPATGVYVNGNAPANWLDTANPYLCGGLASPPAAGPLDGIVCTAEFDDTTGTLTLWNYSGDYIYSPFAGDLIINLIGNNSIATTASTNGINMGTSGNVMITSTSNGSLSIGVVQGGGAIIIGINANNDVTIGGSANVSIDVYNTSSASAIGIDASGTINILNSANLSIIAESVSTATYAATALYSFNGGININTTGSVTLDTSQQTNDSYTIYVWDGDANLIRAHILTLLYSGDGCSGGGCISKASRLWNGDFIFDDTLFDFDESGGLEIYTWINTTGDEEEDDGEENGNIGVPSTGYPAQTNQSSAAINALIPISSLGIITIGTYLIARKFAKK